MASPQAGWYPDPSGDTTKLRYWDGAQWTDQFTPAQAAQPTMETPASVPEQPNQGQQFTTTQTSVDPSGNVVTTVQSTYIQPNGQQTYAMSSTDNTLRLIAFILNIITLVGVCWLIIPLAWGIPMTVRSWSIYKGTKPNTTAFGVCTLLFLNLISGILLLCSTKDA